MPFQLSAPPDETLRQLAQEATEDDLEALGRAHSTLHAKAKEACESLAEGGPGHVDVSGSIYEPAQLVQVHDALVERLQALDPTWTHTSAIPDDCPELANLQEAVAGRSGWCIGPSRRRALIDYGHERLAGKRAEFISAARKNGVSEDAVDGFLEQSRTRLTETITEWRQADLEVSEGECRFPTKDEAFAGVDELVAAEVQRIREEIERQGDANAGNSDGYTVKASDVNNLISSAESRFDKQALERRQELRGELTREGVPLERKREILREFERQAGRLKPEVRPFVRGLVGETFADWSAVLEAVDEFIRSLIESIEIAALSESAGARPTGEAQASLGERFARDAMDTLYRRAEARLSGLWEQRPAKWELPPPEQFADAVETVNALRLFKWHRKTHDHWDEIQENVINTGEATTVNGWDLNRLKAAHDQIVQRLARIEPAYDHSSPLEVKPLVRAALGGRFGDLPTADEEGSSENSDGDGNGGDGESSPELLSVEVREALTGSQVAQRLRGAPDQLMLVPDYVSLVGSALESDAPNDTDLLIRSAVADPATMQQMRRVLGREGSDLHPVYNPKGPHEAHMPLYHLMLVRADQADPQRISFTTDEGGAQEGPDASLMDRFGDALTGLRDRLARIRRTPEQRDGVDEALAEARQSGLTRFRQLHEELASLGDADTPIDEAQSAFLEELAAWREGASRPSDDPQDLRAHAQVLLARKVADARRAVEGSGSRRGLRVLEGCFWLGDSRIDDLVEEFRAKLRQEGELSESRIEEIMGQVREELERLDSQESSDNCIFNTKDEARAHIREFIAERTQDESEQDESEEEESEQEQPERDPAPEPEPEPESEAGYCLDPARVQGLRDEAARTLADRREEIARVAERVGASIEAQLAIIEREVGDVIENWASDDADAGPCTFDSQAGAMAETRRVTDRRIDMRLRRLEDEEIEGERNEGGTELRVKPTELTFRVSADGSLPGPKTVELTTDAERSEVLWAAGAPSWLRLSPDHGKTPDSFQAALVPAEVERLQRSMDTGQPTETVTNEITFRIGRTTARADVPERVVVTLILERRGTRTAEAAEDREFIKPMTASTTLTQAREFSERGDE